MITWIVEVCDEFEPEFERFEEYVQDELLTHAKLIEKFGPTLGRPYVDTLKASRYANMKELRFNAANGVWRVAFAFSPERKVILLAAGNKAGKSEPRLYRELIAKADKRYEAHLKILKSRLG